MEYVEDKIFYHIGNLIAGKSYETSEKLNPFYDYFNHFGYASPLDFEHMKKLISDYQLYIRERIFEDVRLESFPELPSRKTCFWLIPVDHFQERIAYWSKALASDKRIYKVSCTGFIHVADEAFLASRFGYLPSYRDDAYKYWSGESKSDSFVHQEVLFKGKLDVLQEINK